MIINEKNIFLRDRISLYNIVSNVNKSSNSNNVFLNNMFSSMNREYKSKEELSVEKQNYINKINYIFSNINLGEKVFLKLTNPRSIKNGSIGYINAKKTKLPHFETYEEYIQWRQSAKFVISFDGKNEKDITITSLYFCLLIPGDQSVLKTIYISKERGKNKKIKPDKVDSLGKVIKVGQACMIATVEGMDYGFITKISENKTVYITRIGRMEYRISSPENKITVFDPGEDMYKKIVKLKILRK